MNKKALLMFTGIYLLLIGIVNLTGVMWVATQKEGSEGFYNASMGQLTDIKKFRLSHQVDNLQNEKNFDEKLVQIQNKLLEFKKTKIDAVPLHAWLITFFDLLAGVLFIISGLKVFQRSLNVKQFLKLAVMGFGLSYSLKMWDGFFMAKFMDSIMKETEDLILIADPNFQKTFSSSEMPLLWAVIYLLIFVIIPLALISNKTVKEQLCSTGL